MSVPGSHAEQELCGGQLPLRGAREVLDGREDDHRRHGHLLQHSFHEAHVLYAHRSAIASAISSVEFSRQFSVITYGSREAAISPALGFKRGK